MSKSDIEEKWEDLEKLQRYYRGEIEERPNYDYVEKLQEYINSLDEDWEIESKNGSVLRWDKIKEFATDENKRLIQPFRDKHLKAASYQLTVGDTYDMNNNVKHLSRDEELVIDPFDVVVIRTREIVNMPRNLIGRWNIKVSKAYEGLVWVGGPQVDPGFAGHLFCPIYNLSNQKRKLKFGDEIAVLDFIMTTEYEEKDLEYDMERPKEDGLDFEKYRGLQSGLVSEARERIDDNESSIEDLRKDMSQWEDRTVRYSSYIMTIFVIIITILSVIVVASGTTPTFSQNIPEVLKVSGGVLAFFALVISTLAYSKLKWGEN